MTAQDTHKQALKNLENAGKTTQQAIDELGQFFPAYNIATGLAEIAQTYNTGNITLPDALAQGAVLVATSVAGKKVAGAMPASLTIKPYVEAVINGKKELIRVDIEPGGKLQIQVGHGKNSVRDFRPELDKPLAPQINERFKNLPQSARDQLIKNAEKGLQKLKELGEI